MTVNYGPLRRPASYSPGRPEGPPRFVVVHYTAGSETRSSAEDGAAYDARRTDQVSTHYFHDQDSTVQCVDTADRAHAALFRGNLWGIQHELCGTQQTPAEWMSPASKATLDNAARAIARDLQDWGLPLVRLVGSQVRTGRGVAGHKDCTIGFWEDGGTHMDPDGDAPGSFPWGYLLEKIGEFHVPTTPPATPTQSVRKWRPNDGDVCPATAPGNGPVFWTDVLKAFYLVPFPEGSAQWTDHVWRLRALYNDPKSGPGQYERVSGGKTTVNVPARLGY